MTMEHAVSGVTDHAIRIAMNGCSHFGVIIDDSDEELDASLRKPSSVLNLEDAQVIVHVHLTVLDAVREGGYTWSVQHRPTAHRTATSHRSDDRRPSATWRLANVGVDADKF